jgi:hypothetical protein
MTRFTLDADWTDRMAEHRLIGGQSIKKARALMTTLPSDRADNRSSSSVTTRWINDRLPWLPAGLNSLSVDYRPRTQQPRH